MAANLISIGKILKPVGLAGKLKIKLFTIGSQSLKFSRDLCLRDGKGSAEHFEVEELSWSENAVIVKLKGVNSSEEALTFKGFEVCIDAEKLPKLKEGEYYQHELIGCLVVTLDGRRIGKLVDLLPTKSNGVFQVEGDGKEYLIPATDDVVKSIDLKNKLIKIDPIEGLLDD